jgi:hypothetical protein
MDGRGSSSIVNDSPNRNVLTTGENSAARKQSAQDKGIMSDREAARRLYGRPSPFKFAGTVICASFLLVLGACSSERPAVNFFDCRSISQERERSAALILIGEVHQNFRLGSGSGRTAGGAWFSVIDDVRVTEIIKNKLGAIPKEIHVISKQYYDPATGEPYSFAVTSEGFVGAPLNRNSVSLIVLKPISEELRYNRYPVDYELTFSKSCSDLSSQNQK